MPSRRLSQRWTLPPVGTPGEVRIWGGMCLDDDMGGWREGDKVHVTAVSKGKGFQGTVKRHGFGRGPVSHGSHNVRAPGSIGAPVT